jgi:hypothetical protein
MGVANPPLEQWQIDHIRKMQEDLGMPSEERPVDETDYMDQTPDDEGNAYPAMGGGLGAPDAYNAYQAAQKRVDDQIKANIDLLTSAQMRLRERRAGPSNAEKWFSIAAALGKPTRTGSFGESLGNLNEVLAKQNAMKREAQEERDALLEQYGMKIGGEQLRMLQSGATQAGQIYRAEMAANKPVRGIAVGDKLVNPYTNETMGAKYNRVPMPGYYKALEQDPTPENLQAALDYYPSYAVELKAAYDRGAKNKGR